MKRLFALGAIGLTLFSAVTESPGALSAQGVEEIQDDTAPDLLGKKRGRAHVSIRVRDDLWNDIRVVSAALEDQDVKLKKKPNFLGLKGALDTQLEPGEYTVRWTVTKPASKGNRITLSFHKTFTVSSKRSVTVTITGQQASVS